MFLSQPHTCLEPGTTSNLSQLPINWQSVINLVCFHLFASYRFTSEQPSSSLFTASSCDKSYKKFRSIVCFCFVFFWGGSKIWFIHETKRSYVGSDCQSWQPRAVPVTDSADVHIWLFPVHLWTWPPLTLHLQGCERQPNGRTSCHNHPFLAVMEPPQTDGHDKWEHQWKQ